jgi:hypothetical protein
VGTPNPKLKAKDIKGHRKQEYDRKYTNRKMLTIREIYLLYPGYHRDLQNTVQKTLTHKTLDEK